MSIERAYDSELDFRITGIVYEEDAPVSGPSRITFGDGSTGNSDRYGRPAISIDNKARFVTHEIIGGTTVRQKIGEEPREASISGVCIEETARELDTLRDAKRANIFCDRFPGGSMTVHIASVSTSPLDDGGAANITQGEIIYNWSMKAVEINSLGRGGSSSGDSSDGETNPGPVDTGSGGGPNFTTQ